MDRLQRLLKKSQNIYRLHELVDGIVAGVQPGSRFILSEDIIKRLHVVAMQDLLAAPGTYRTEAVHITNSPHKCPNWIEVPTQMSSLCIYLNENWERRNLLHLSAFTLWRMCWIHPFINGNGRTARALSYLVLCARNGGLFPPKNTIIEQIQADKKPYYDALRMADDLYVQTSDIDQSIAHFELLLSGLLKKQLQASLA